MAYDSILYLFIFLPAVLLAYQLAPMRHRYKVLLLASYVFFLSISGKLLVYLLFSTLSIHHTGLWLSSCKKDYGLKEPDWDDKKALKSACSKKQRRILWFGIGLQLGILLLLKYSGFFCENMNLLLKAASFPKLLPEMKFALPIGISFYTLQAVSYLIDVYYEKIEADDHLGRLALYLSFFPAIMEGPICRYSQTAAVLHQGRPLEYKNVTFGIQRMLWGLFKKLVIADRLNMLAETVFGNPGQYSGIPILVAAVLYTFQLYADFSGCIDMTIGTGEMFGIIIPENFRQPFFSKTASEFWRRWHITLGTWLKDYVFYPISLTRFAKKLGKSSRAKFGKHMGQVLASSIALFGVWICNGLWHGTGWNYIFFGMYYFVLIMLGNLSEPLVQKITDLLKIDRRNTLYRGFQTLKMLPIIFTGELFFRADSLKSGLLMFRSIFTGFSWSAATDGSLLKLGLSLQDFTAVLFGFLVVYAVGVIHEKGISIRGKISGWNLFARWGFLYAAILTVIILGAYGDGYLPAKLIYAGF
ncbi:MBOAT family O-acyltransferase [Clostridium sp. Marseille-P2415]|uniref:MBOAT family O-acyltransferase n=1 Tax=Clostridium sp. Marseille-P2415 TaxID=1805471 RepID=UPI0009888582|nr:MBOAT family O-acyltransferase [Clostridium sp. Marseille-P2415]